METTEFASNVQKLERPLYVLFCCKRCILPSVDLLAQVEPERMLPDGEGDRQGDGEGELVRIVAAVFYALHYVSHPM